MRKTVLFTATMLVVGMMGTALAVDFWGGPPAGTWNRFDPGSTYQHWDFVLPDISFPDIWDNPYGEPFADFDPASGWDYGQWEAPPEVDPSGIVTGYHCNDPNGGSITLTIPNTENMDGIKSIFLQVTSSKAPTGATATGAGGSPGGYTSGTWNTGRPQIQHPGPAPFGGAWYTYNFGLFIIPNPQFETITLTFPFCTVVDQIVVDTICSTDPVAVEESSWSRVKALFR